MCSSVVRRRPHVILLQLGWLADSQSTRWLHGFGGIRVVVVFVVIVQIYTLSLGVAAYERSSIEVGVGDGWEALPRALASVVQVRRHCCCTCGLMGWLVGWLVGWLASCDWTEMLE